MTTDSTPTPAEPIPFKPETWPVDADGFTPDLCTECGTPVRYGSRHTKCAPGWRATPAAAEIAQPAAPESELLQALETASEWISGAPHGDNCFVSDHYPGDPGNRCNCGKDSIEEYLDGVIERATQAQPATHAEVPHDCGMCVPAGLSAARCEACPHIQAEATDEPLTDRELQTLRNMGNEAERAADEIVSLRAAIATQAAQTHQSNTEN